MKLQFKQQQFQLDAVNAVVDLFQGQPKRQGIDYLMDPGEFKGPYQMDIFENAYRNAPIELDEASIKKQVNDFQTRYGLQRSAQLSVDYIGGRPSYNFSIEMETGTGKTYTYIRTIMELHKRYGWLKFVIVVPSVAIREGVLKSFEVTADHFQMEYGTKPDFFVYNSSSITSLKDFSTEAKLKVMIINAQAFNATGKDARRIHMELEKFAWRRPIDSLAAMNPIMIIDEPQSVEGKKTKERLKDFKPLFTLRYSATHKEKYDMVYRLDAMDAYNKKLVKKIAVKAIEQTGATGTQGYLYLQNVEPQRSGSPKARVEFDVKTKTGIKRRVRLVEEPFDLYAESGQLEAYKGWTLSHFDARDNKIQVGTVRDVYAGEVLGNPDESVLRAIQIKETVASHLKREEVLFHRGIKVLSLFFIDEVAKYKQYDDQHNPYNGEYAEIFEAEYQRQVQDYLDSHGSSPYRDYLASQIDASQVHAGYFSVDKVKKTDKLQFVDYKSTTERRNQQSSDTDAYDLIMRDKERLLSFEEPVRFLFSHSALKEGWDNPNVFQICTLKQSTAETRMRQEIGRGMRLSVDQYGVRQDQDLLGADVHEINKLTVIASESYEDFSRKLQDELQEVLADRPSKVDRDLFMNKVLINESGQSLVLTQEQSDIIWFHLARQGYVNEQGQLTETYFEAKESGELVFSESVAGYEQQIQEILDSIYTPGSYDLENAKNGIISFRDEVNRENLERKEFQELWQRINHKSSYRVEFDDEELIEKAIAHIDKHLTVSRLSYTITRASADRIDQKEGLQLKTSENSMNQEYSDGHPINIEYDLLGEVAEATDLTRKTVARILTGINNTKFDFFKINPEEFILKISRLINEEKAAQIVNHIRYNILEDRYDTDLFYDNPETSERKNPNLRPSTKGVYNYAKLDSDKEKEFMDQIEGFEDIRVYVKLPKGFKIPTPMGDYNPDWAIAFREGSVKHVYFVAETKGSLSSMQLRKSEEGKIDCARVHFQALKDAGLIDDGHIYGVVTSYQNLLDLVRE